MAEAIFACEKIKKLPLIPAAATLALFHAELSRLAKNFLMRHSPGDAGYGKRKQKEDDDLRRQTHTFLSVPKITCDLSLKPALFLS